MPHETRTLPRRQAKRSFISKGHRAPPETPKEQRARALAEKRRKKDAEIREKAKKGRSGGGTGGGGARGGVGPAEFDKRIGKFVKRSLKGSETFTIEEVRQGFRRL